MARRQEPRNREVPEGWVAKVPPPPELPRSEAILVAKPRLGDEVEALFAEAAALVALRPRRNTRLQVLEEEMQRHGAAKKIGTAWRQKAQHRQQKAAQLLQNHFRGWRARRVVQKEREKQRASRLQRWWRKKRFYLAWLQTHQQRKAAVKLQAFHRGNKARQEVYNMLVLHSWAVLRMQAVFRGQRARRKARKQQQSARKIQVHWRWHRLWQAYLRQRAAMKLQTFLRGVLARWHLVQLAAKAPKKEEKVEEEVQEAPKKDERVEEEASSKVQEAPKKDERVEEEAASSKVQEASEEDEIVVEDLQVYDFSASQLTAFALQPRPKDVILSAEMLLVKRRSNIFSQDVVYGNGVAPRSQSGSYFEVRLESPVARGFALGFQSANAVGSKLIEVPATACSLGFDGMACMGGTSFLVSDWPAQPIRWESADRLGLLASAGFLALAVNGQRLLEVPGAMPEGPLVPFVDLGGGPMAVSLEVGAQPPQGGALGGFHRRLCSPLVTLEGKTKATRTGVHPKGAGLGCVLFGDGPVPTFPEGRYFEVCIEEVTQVFADGLNLGVALSLPSGLPLEPFATCEEVPKSFCYGFDGMAHRYDLEDLIAIDWSPVNLEIGDAVGILVTPQGVMQLIVNGVLEANVIDAIPQEELFPLVELMGNTVSVSLRPGAAPPAIQQKVREAPEVPESAEPEPVLPAAPEMPTETILPAPAPLANTQRPSTAPAPRRSTEQPKQTPKATEPAFSAQLLSKNMQLSKDGNSVRHKDESGQELFGIAVGVSPLIPFPAGRYFEVRVDRVRQGMPDGLALGFTLVPPNELAGEDPHEVSDTLPESWTAGYDGFYRSVNLGENEQVRVDWKPSSLEINDRVGALLSRAGQFIIVVNGKVVVRVTDDFPLADVEAFYPVVDLLGRVCQVTMVRDAVPPAGAAEGTIFTGFDPKLLGKAVSLSNSRLSCSSSDPVGNALGGVVFGDAPLPCTGPDGEAYFEVVVEELRQGNDDGLVLGVASKKPQSMDDILMGCDVKEAWSIGYNGCSFSPDVEEDLPVKWSPVNLKRGDHVGLLVKGDGSLIILLNGAPVCKGPRKAPVLDVPLYPFVDLLGNTKAVQLVKPTAELVRTGVVNCAKAVKRSLLSSPGKDPAFFDAW